MNCTATFLAIVPTLLEDSLWLRRVKLSEYINLFFLLCVRIYFINSSTSNEFCVCEQGPGLRNHDNDSYINT